MSNAAGEVRFEYSRIRRGLWLLVTSTAVAVGLRQAALADGFDRFVAFVLVILAVPATIMAARLLFDSRPAVLVDEYGIAAQRLGGDHIPWRDVRGVRLHWRKHRVLWIIPLNTPELTLSIRLESAFWLTGGLSRTMSRWLSLAAGDDTVVVNLSGLAGGRPDRVIAEIRRLRPDLVRETMVEGIE